MACLVTAIVPVYNAADTVRAALDSVAAQTVREIEIIVVDDCSTDATAATAGAALEALGWKSGRVIKMPHNRGPAAARNAGIRVAQAEWIAFLDGDDAWVPWRLAEQFAALEHHRDAALLCGEVALIGSTSLGPPHVVGAAPATLVPLEDFVDANPVPTSTVLARRTVLEAVGGFDEQFRGPEDIDLWMRVAAAGKIVKINLPLALYREQPGSLSMNAERFLPEILRVYDKAFAAGGALYPFRRWKRRAVAGRYVSAAWTLLMCGQRARAMGWLLRSWLLWPGRLRIEQNRPLWRLLMLGKIALNLK